MRRMKGLRLTKRFPCFAKIPPSQSQLTGLDDLCFFGSYPLSGSFDTNSWFMFYLWLVTVILFDTLLALKKKIRAYFRLPCSVHEAEYIYIRVPLKAEVLMKTATPLVAWVRKLRAKLTGGVRFFEATVPVKKTLDATKYYELQARRCVGGRCSWDSYE